MLRYTTAELSERPITVVSDGVIAPTVTLNSGDILAFGGRGLVSKVIRAWTCSRISHVGIVCERAGVPLLWESTTLSDLPCMLCGRFTRGVQAVIPSERIARYDGHVWRLRVKRPLESWQIARLLGFLSLQDGVRYDLLQALSAARWLRWVWGSHENWQSWFCSELVIAALVECDVLPAIVARSPAAWRPSNVVKRLPGWGAYHAEMEVIK